MTLGGLIGYYMNLILQMKTIALHPNKDAAAIPSISISIANHKPVKRLQLGVAVDAAFFRKDVRLFVESFNGAPNSPRDSPGFFRSYQAGFKFITKSSWGFHILYGSQPTFNGYEGDTLTYRKTNWVQFGVRKAIDDLF